MSKNKKSKNTTKEQEDDKKNKDVGSWDSYDANTAKQDLKDEDGGVSIFDEEEDDSYEQEFHQEQEKLFRQMSQLFALGKDQPAIQLREQLKANIAKEYERLVSKLEYVPNRLPEIKEEIKEEMKNLEKSLEDHDRSKFNELSEKLWDLRYEMEDVNKVMEKKRELTESKIENFKKKYGNLVPANSSSE